MEIEAFLALSNEAITQIAHQRGPLVCAFPINGTRRWFLLEYPPETWESNDFLSAYLQASVKRQLELFAMFFDHGVDTLMMPLFGLDLLERGEDYLYMAAAGLRQLAEDPLFLDFYQAHGLRVRFFGDYRRYLKHTPYADLADCFDQVTQLTAQNERGRLLFGVFGSDPAERVAELSVDYFNQHHALPDKRTLVSLYYGEYIPPVSLFIGFDRFSAFDMPLVATGSEDLYFTIAPSSYLSQRQLRCILYDHLFARKAEEPDYESLSAEAVERMRAFYQSNQEHTLGVGIIRDGFWYPLPQVTLPDSFSSGQEPH